MLRSGFEPVAPTAVGNPLKLFDNYVLPKEYEDAHKAVQFGMGTNLPSDLYKQLHQQIEDHVTGTQSVREIMTDHKITKNEIIAIAYYTSDCTVLGGTENNSVYRIMNQALANRKNLDNWKPFLWLLLQGLHKLPNFTGTVYRALSKPLSNLSKQYVPSNNVVWVAFTSTSKSKETLKLFSGKDEGTLMQLTVTEGKDITPISLFPSESEILLLPNSTVLVKESLTNELKNLVSLPKSIDALVLEQQETPHHLKYLMKSGNSQLSSSSSSSPSSSSPSSSSSTSTSSPITKNDRLGDSGNIISTSKKTGIPTTGNAFIKTEYRKSFRLNFIGSGIFIGIIGIILFFAIPNFNYYSNKTVLFKAGLVTAYVLATGVAYGLLWLILPAWKEKKY